MRDLRNERGQHAVTLLATCCVVVGGLVSCAFVVTASGATPRQAVLLCSGVFAGVLFVLWLLRDRPPENATARQYSWFKRYWRRKPPVKYQFRRRAAATAEPSPPPAPPTAESVRELAQNKGTWVPARRSPKPE